MGQAAKHKKAVLEPGWFTLLLQQKILTVTTQLTQKCNPPCNLAHHINKGNSDCSHCMQTNIEKKERQEGDTGYTHAGEQKQDMVPVPDRGDSSLVYETPGRFSDQGN